MVHLADVQQYFPSCCLMANLWRLINTVTWCVLSIPGMWQWSWSSAALRGQGKSLGRHWFRSASLLSLASLWNDEVSLNHLLRCCLSEDRTVIRPVI